MEFFETVDGPQPQCDGEVIRKDRRRALQGFFEWSLDSRMGFRVTAGRTVRRSNCLRDDDDVVAYTANEVSFAVSFGWY